MDGMGCRRPPHFPPRARLRLPGSLRRRQEGRLLGGIAVGLSERIPQLDVTLIRVGLVLAGLFTGGVAVAAYCVGWLLLPLGDPVADGAEGDGSEGSDETIAARALSDAKGLTIVVALIPALVVALVLAHALHAGWFTSLMTSGFIGAMGLVLIWRNGDDEDRAAIRQVAEPLAQFGSGQTRSVRGLVIRLALGVVLAGLAVVDFSFGTHPAALRPLAGAGLVLGALVVVFGPWWLSLARDLVDERQARLRAEERAEMASRVHDSVLQTLAMIQRHADDPQRVSQLARAQERELRSWLFDGAVPGSFAASGSSGLSGSSGSSGGQPAVTTVAGAVRRIEEEVEAAHGIRVETVVVGDCPLSEDLEALLAAGREATVNAGKWSGAESVSLFVEVEPELVSLFVRDRGKGFDPSAVAPDRKGVAESVRGRVTRRGGTAVVRSAPGEGTEVALTMPRVPGSRSAGAAR